MKDKKIAATNIASVAALILFVIFLLGLSVYLSGDLNARTLTTTQEIIVPQTTVVTKLVTLANSTTITATITRSVVNLATEQVVSYETFSTVVTQTINGTVIRETTMISTSVQTGSVVTVTSNGIQTETQTVMQPVVTTITVNQTQPGSTSTFITPTTTTTTEQPTTVTLTQLLTTTSSTTIIITATQTVTSTCTISIPPC